MRKNLVSLLGPLIISKIDTIKGAIHIWLSGFGKQISFEAHLSAFRWEPIEAIA